jgi:tRNA(Ile)-lysidine synthase
MNKLSPKAHSTIIVGFSGGPDSMFLLQQLHAIREHYSLNIIAAHLDHQWRQESTNDAEFCKKVCDKFSIPIVIGRASDIELTKKPSGSQEDLGRQLRRTFFERVARECNADTIALAHHADDQLETFLIRLIRGTTLSGLTCMKERDGLYWRPLLSMTKQEIVDYLIEHKIEFLTDPTNTQDIHLRNKIRKYVIPALRTCDTRIDANVQRTINQLTQAQNFIDTVVTQHMQIVCPDKKSINLPAFRTCDPFAQRQIMVDWLCANKASCTLSEGIIAEIVRFLVQPAGGVHKVTDLFCVKKEGKEARILLV